MALIDPGFTSALSLALEQAINAALRLDPGTRTRLRKLDQCVFQFACSKPEMNLYFEINANDNKIDVASYSEKTVTTKISASLLDTLVFIAAGKLDETRNLTDSGISILGNSAELALLQNILQDLDIDWEQALLEASTPGGETAGILTHQTASTIKLFLAWLKKSREKLQRNFTTYLQEELRVIPTHVELNHFYEDLADLRSGIERADARIAALFQKLKSH